MQNKSARIRVHIPKQTLRPEILRENAGLFK
jgi:hypothetical protein